MDEVLTGVCEWFGSNGQSYGYIKYNDDCQVYVHYKHIEIEGLRDPKYKEIRPGDKVQFRIIEGHGNNTGTQATEVIILEYGDRDNN